MTRDYDAIVNNYIAKMKNKDKQKNYKGISDTARKKGRITKRRGVNLLGLYTLRS
jgi:hypothetical protein